MAVRAATDAALLQAAETWAVPAIESVDALANWLSVAPNEFNWFTNLKGMGGARTRLNP